MAALLALVFIAATRIGSATSASASTTHIRVVTYNTDCSLCDLSHEHGPSFAARASRERAVLTEINADIIFLEEPVDHHDIKAILPIDRKWTILFDNHTTIQDPDATIAVDASRFNVVDWGFFWLGPHPSRAGSFDLFTLPRLAVWADLHEPVANASFVTMATHFDHGDGTGKGIWPSTTNCVQAAREVARMLRDNSKLAKRPLLFGGDLNSHTTSNAYAILRNETILSDTWFKTSNHTIFANSSEAAASYKKTIDHIFATPDFDVLGAGSSVRAWPSTKKGAKDVPPSDHYPVFADVRLR